MSAVDQVQIMVSFEAKISYLIVEKGRIWYKARAIKAITGEIADKVALLSCPFPLNPHTYRHVYQGARTGVFPARVGTWDAWRFNPYNQE